MRTEKTKLKFGVPEKYSGFFQMKFMKLNYCLLLNYLVAIGLAMLTSACTGINGDEPSSSMADKSAWLIPTPKEVKVGETLIIKPSCYNIDDALKMPADAIKWLKGELLNNLGWKEAVSGKARRLIKITCLKKSKNKEFYTLKISQDKIEIGASSQEGCYRAIGRLLCIFDSPLVKILTDGSIQCPEIAIKDWPDFSLRGMHLRLLSYRQKEENSIKYKIDVMSRLGFNFVVLEIGGYYESLKHPECCMPPRWSQKKLRDLVYYAKSRGIMPVPGINSIGHLGTGPLICPIKGIGKDGKERPVVMNLAAPDFYNIYFDMVDELSELFEKPPYFHIGTDEFAFYDGAQILEKTIGKSGHEYFAEFLNKASRHFASKGIKPVIWHDMLVDENKYDDKDEEENEPANGHLTFKALDNIDKNIVIDYWCYLPHKRYDILEDISKKGFEIWVSPWYNEKGIERLCFDGFRLGAKAALGTTWNNSPHHEAFPMTGECSWNATARHNKSSAVYATFNDIFFYGRGTKKPNSEILQIKDISGTTQPSSTFLKKLADALPEMKMDASGIPLEIINPRSFFIFGSTPPPKIPRPYNFKKMMENGKLKDIIISAQSYEWISPAKVRVDKERESKECIIYTPAYGKSTRTNRWGKELAVRNDKIVQLSGNLLDYDKGQGNMEIPEDGFVISNHGPVRRGQFWEYLRTGDRISILLRNQRQSPAGTISMPISYGLRNFIVFITTEYPVDASRSLGKIEVDFSDGTKSSIDLRGRSFFKARRSVGNWRTWMAWRGSDSRNMNNILAIEWQSPKRKQAMPKKVKVTASPEGVQSGLVVLGGVQY